MTPSTQRAGELATELRGYRGGDCTYRELMDEAADLLETLSTPPQVTGDDVVKHMVTRFLMWRLPEHFSPDAGISFRPSFAEEPLRSRQWPVGTNLFNADQAEAMVRFMIDGLANAHERVAKEAKAIEGYVEEQRAKIRSGGRQFRKPFRP